VALEALKEALRVRKATVAQIGEFATICRAINMAASVRARLLTLSKLRKEDFNLTLTCFASESPFSHSALDIKTLAMALLKRPYRESTKRNMPKRWFHAGLPHTHQALDDAIEQGAMFCNMLVELKAAQVMRKLIARYASGSIPVTVSS
jgi:hypothetical protein